VCLREGERERGTPGKNHGNDSFLHRYVENKDTQRSDTSVMLIVVVFLCYGLVSF
jgi:hypothetical protein